MCMCIYVHVYICTCVYIYIYMYVCIYYSVIPMCRFGNYFDATCCRLLLLPYYQNKNEILFYTAYISPLFISMD